MRSILFQLRRFLLSLTDAFFFPFRKFADLWNDPTRGRALLFGMPAVLVAVVGISAALVAMGSQQRFIANYEVVKDEAVKNKEWDEAIVYMHKLIQLKPGDADAKWEFARILLLDDREESRESSIRTARGLIEGLAPTDRPGYAPAHIMTCRRILRMRGIPPETKINNAEKHLRLALEADPGNQDAMTLLADLEIARKNYREALNLYIKLFDDFVGYHVKITELYTALGSPADAEPYISRALEKYEEYLEEDPRNLDYLRRLANCHAMLGNHEAAIEGLKKAIDEAERASSRRALAQQLAKIYLSYAQTVAGRLEVDPEARETYMNRVIDAFRVDPESNAAKIALTRFGLSGLEGAERALEIYDPRENPEDAPDAALQLMGTREVTQGDTLIGIRLLELAIQKNPSNHEALNNLAFTLIETDLERAFDLANRAVSLMPRQHNYLDTRGNIHMQMGNYAKAINDLEKARIGFVEAAKASGKPENINVYIALVHCYEQQGMLETARSFQKRVDELRARMGQGASPGSDRNPGQ